MRVGENVTVFAGDTQAALDREGTRNDRQSGEKKAVYAGGLTGNIALRDRIAQKKEQAQKRALKIVSDMWEGDRKIDQELDKSRRIAEESAETLKDARENLESIEAQKEKVRNYYGIKEGDEELVQRGRREQAARTMAEAYGQEYQPGEDALTEQEWSRYQDLESRGFENYERWMTDLGKAEGYYRQTIAQAKGTIEGENSVIRGMRLERLKKDPMVEAQKQAEEVLEAARQDVIGMVQEEAKKHLDEEQEKREEQAEAVEEKKEEMEEILEERREEDEELEELLEEMPVQESMDMKQVQAEVRQEVQKILGKMNLVAEDIKGSKVDAAV